MRSMDLDSGRSTDGVVGVALLKFLAINWKRICLCAHNWKAGILSSRYLWLWYLLQVVHFFWYSGKVVSMLKILKMIILFLMAPHAYLIASESKSEISKLINTNLWKYTRMFLLIFYKMTCFFFCPFYSWAMNSYYK